MRKPSPAVGNRSVTDGGRSAGAVRQAEHRARERDGILRCIFVPVGPEVLEALIDRGLEPAAALDPKAVGRELGDVLRQWARRWQQEKNFP
jgi:hypothetical protein